MRRRTALPATIAATAAAALLAVLVALPGSAAADTAPTGAVPSASTSPTPPSDSPSEAPAPTASGASDGTGPVQVTTATPGLPFASDLGRYTTPNQLVVDAWDVTSLGGTDPAFTDITGVTLHFRLHGAAADSPDDAVVATREVAAYWAEWATPSDIVLPQLGTYDVSVEVTDKQGNDVVVPDVGQFAYAATVAVTDLRATPGNLDYDHRTVTITGKVAVTDPRTGLAIAPDQLEIAMVSTTGWAQSGQAFPDAAGDFTTTATVLAGPTLTFDAYWAQGDGAVPYRLQSTTVSNAVGIAPEATRIRLLEPASIDAKKGPVVLKGVVERDAGGVWLPAPDLQVDGGTYPVTSAADGTFQSSVTFAGSYSFSTAGDTDTMGTNGIYLTGSRSGSVRVHIPAQTYFGELSYDENAYGQAEITGFLDTGGQTLPNNKQNVTVEFSSDKKTWHMVGLTKIGRPGVGSNTVQFWATYNGTGNGYWRLYYPGTVDWAPAYSGVMHLYRTPTEVTGGRPSTTAAYRGQSLTFSGSLRQHLTSWTGMAGQKVILAFRPYHGKVWYSVASARTRAKGAYTLHARASSGGTWAVVYQTPDNHHIDSNGPEVYVRIR